MPCSRTWTGEFETTVVGAAGHRGRPGRLHRVHQPLRHEHPGTKATVELLFLLDTLATASLDNLLTLTSTNPQVDLRWTRNTSPAAFATIADCPSLLPRAAARPASRFGRAITAYFQDVRLSILRQILRTTPSGIPVQRRQVSRRRDPLVTAPGGRGGARVRVDRRCRRRRPLLRSVYVAVASASVHPADRSIDARSIEFWPASTRRGSASRSTACAISDIASTPTSRRPLDYGTSGACTSER